MAIAAFVGSVEGAWDAYVGGKEVGEVVEEYGLGGVVAGVLLDGRGEWGGERVKVWEEDAVLSRGKVVDEVGPVYDGILERVEGRGRPHVVAGRQQPTR